MLAKNPTAALPKIFLAYPDGYVVQLAADLLCPGCQGVLLAVDVEDYGPITRLVCSSCHRNVLTVERTP